MSPINVVHVVVGGGVVVVVNMQRKIEEIIELLETNCRNRSIGSRDVVVVEVVVSIISMSHNNQNRNGDNHNLPTVYAYNKLTITIILQYLFNCHHYTTLHLISAQNTL